MSVRPLAIARQIPCVCDHASRRRAHSGSAERLKAEHAACVVKAAGYGTQWTARLACSNQAGSQRWIGRRPTVSPASATMSAEGKAIKAAGSPTMVLQQKAYGMSSDWARTR